MKRLAGFFLGACLASIASPSHAACYGSGYSRWCDGIGGSSATYSSRGSYGSTSYYNPSGSLTRIQTYTPSFSSTSYFGKGNSSSLFGGGSTFGSFYSTPKTSRFGYGSGSYFGW